jgi:hypothetical protein
MGKQRQRKLLSCVPCRQLKVSYVRSRPCSLCVWRQRAGECVYRIFSRDKFGIKVWYAYATGLANRWESYILTFIMPEKCARIDSRSKPSKLVTFRLRLYRPAFSQPRVFLLPSSCIL